jgi:hypothetical protein
VLAYQSEGGKVLPNSAPFVGPVARLIAGACLIALTTACQQVSEPATEFEPTTVGVVRSVAVAGGAETTFELEDGERLVVDLRPGSTANDVPGTPRSGQLLIYVADVHGKPWLVALSGVPDCYTIRGRAVDKGKKLVFETGLTLGKASNYDSGGHGTDYTNGQSRFCVSPDGLVEKYTGSAS